MIALVDPADGTDSYFPSFAIDRFCYSPKQKNREWFSVFCFYLYLFLKFKFYSRENETPSYAVLRNLSGIHKLVIRRQ